MPHVWHRYLAAFDQHIMPALRAFAPDLILISCGFDAHRDDSPSLTGFLTLDAEHYAQLTARLASVAAECCEGRLVSLLEGGYNLSALAECTRAHVGALAVAAAARGGGGAAAGFGGRAFGNVPLSKQSPSSSAADAPAASASPVAALPAAGATRR